MDSHDLDDLIIDRVQQATACGEPITVARGMFYDREMKRELAIPGTHQSVVCTNVKQLIGNGMLQLEPTGLFRTVYTGGRTRLYEEMRLLLG